MSLTDRPYLRSVGEVGRASFFCAMIVLLLCVCQACCSTPRPLSLKTLNKGLEDTSGPFVYDGPGDIVLHMESDPAMPRGENVTTGEAFMSDILGQSRPLAVYTPPGYDPEREEPYPVIYALHGFGGRYTMWLPLIPPVVEAFEAGVIPDAVIVMVDFSLSGTGLDDPDTYYDDRGGSFYINTNQGRFEDHFFCELVPFVTEHYHVRTDAEGVVLIGASMGGYGVLWYGIGHPDFSHILIPIFPPADLRYSIEGDRLADYDPERYTPVTTDDPNRIVNASVLWGCFGVTEEFIYYAVFDSDRTPGEVWIEDLPVWQRFKEFNPVEVLADEHPDLSGQRYFIIAGGEDDFNLDAHIPIIAPLLSAAGARVSPPEGERITPGGRHNAAFVEARKDEIFRWLGDELKEGLGPKEK
ncbi:MAG: hypothetical protein JW885_09200 [Deltaproteobacteria bacterium]|nr:hypothetical protein [Candidatus Zymogenaceae bacterium]